MSSSSLAVAFLRLLLASLTGSKRAGGGGGGGGGEGGGRVGGGGGGKGEGGRVGGFLEVKLRSRVQCSVSAPTSRLFKGWIGTTAPGML